MLGTPFKSGPLFLKVQDYACLLKSPLAILTWMEVGSACAVSSARFEAAAALLQGRRISDLKIHSIQKSEQKGVALGCFVPPRQAGGDQAYCRVQIPYPIPCPPTLGNALTHLPALECSG